MTDEAPSDEKLLAAIQQGDLGALEAFYDLHHTLAYSLALRLLGDVGDAEDVLQESFLNIWRSAATYKASRGHPRSWLLSIVHHKAIDKLRGRQSRLDPLALDEAPVARSPDDVWQEVAQNLTRQDVEQALQRLPVDQREVIELAFFKGYTHTEIASLIQAPLGTVKGRMRIGLHKLRSILEGSEAELTVDR